MVITKSMAFAALTYINFIALTVIATNWMQQFTKVQQVVIAIVTSFVLVAGASK